MQEGRTNSNAAPSELLWSRIQSVYNASTASGAAIGIGNKPSLLLSKTHGISFVLRVADSLRSKPKSPRHTEYAVSSGLLDTLEYRRLAGNEGSVIIQTM
jgi:hypothetical protein